MPYQALSLLEDRLTEAVDAFASHSHGMLEGLHGTWSLVCTSARNARAF